MSFGGDWQSSTFQLVIISAGGSFSGLFVYSPAPGTGNLVYSVAAAAGTDPYGNSYLKGSTSYGTSGVMNENGATLLVYSPAAALGDLIASIAPAQTTDTFGNNVNAGINSYDTVFGGVFQASGGTVTLASGANLIETINNKGYFAYSPAGGLGNLVYSAAPAAGTDQYGNAFVAGVASYAAAGNVRLNSGQVIFANPVNAGATNSLISIGQAGKLLLDTGLNATGDNNLFIAFNSRLSSPAGVPDIEVGVGQAVASRIVTNRVIAWQPGSTNGTVEGWNSLGTLANYTVGFGRYRMTTDNCVELDIDVTSAGANAAATTFQNSLPAAYQPTAIRRMPLASTRAVTAGDNWPRLVVNTNGTVVVQSTASISASLGTNVRVPLD